MADWDVVSSDKSSGDPWAVVSHESHDTTAPQEDERGRFHPDWSVSAADVAKTLGDLPGVGLASRIGQGIIRLGGKAASGFAGMAGGPDAVRRVQNTVNEATELPPSNDPILGFMGHLQDSANQVVAPAERAQGNLPPALRTGLEAAEEAVPDIAGLLGNPTGAGLAGRTAQGVGRLGKNAAVRLGLSDDLLRTAPPEAAPAIIARSPADVGYAAGYTGLRTKADLAAPGNQAITDTLISRDAGIVSGQTPSIAALENAMNVGPGRKYRQVEQSLPPTLTQDDELRADLGNLPQQVSQLPRAPNVDALQETMLSKPNMTRDELFANIREARERAKAAWKSSDAHPDNGVLGDAYASLANAYEDFIDRQLKAAGADATLAEWQQARTQFAKNYQAQGALRGENFDAGVYGKIAKRNPHLLTGDAAVVGHVANGLPSAGVTDIADVAPTVGGVAAGELLGQHMGVPVAGGVVGALTAPMIRAKLEQLLTRGRPDLAAVASTNPALSYFYNQDRLPSGWNRSPPQIAGLLPAPAPFGGASAVNAGGGATTLDALDALGLTPDVQAAGAQHPGAARLAALREHLVNAPERPADPIDFQGPQKWGDFSLTPGAPVAPALQADTVPFENVLEQGGTRGKPVGGITRVPPRPAPQSPKGPNMRTPPGAPELTEYTPFTPSDAQVAFRNQQAAARLRKVAGDLSVEGPGGNTGSMLDRLRAALERRERGYAQGGEVATFDDGGTVPSPPLHPRQPLSDALTRLATVPSAGADPAAQAAYLARARVSVGDPTASLMRLRAILDAKAAATQTPPVYVNAQ